MKSSAWFIASILAPGTLALAQAPATRIETRGPVGIEEGGFKIFWEARLPLGPGEALESVYLRDDAVYVASDGGALFSLHSETGLLRWGEVLTEAAYTLYAPSHIQTADRRGPVIIPTTNQVYIKDRYSGNDIVRFKPDFPTGSPAVGFDGVILIGSSDGRFYCLAWDPARPAAPIKRWDVLTGGPVSAAPVLNPARNLLIASQSGAVFFAQGSNKVLNWDYKVGGPVMADPALDAGGAYIASMDRSLYKIHLQTGRLVWRTRFHDPLSAAPAVAAQTVYQFTPSQGVMALDAMNGNEKWRRPEATQFVAHASGTDVLLASSDRLLVVDHESGKMLSTIAVPPVCGAAVNTFNDSIYLIGAAGHVLCLRPDKVPYLRRQQVLMTQETLNAPPPLAPTVTVEPPRPAPPPREDPFRSRRDREP